MIIGGLVALPAAQAVDAELVPEPWVHETHEYNVPIDVNVENGGTAIEKWSVEVRHGGVLTLLMARNITTDGTAGVDYTFNTMYTVKGTEYIAQFMMMYVAISFADHQTLQAPLTTCDNFQVSYTPIVYNGTIPTFDCAITYNGLDLLYPDASKHSTLNLTLIHHFYCDWNQTDVKVEALFDLNGTRLYDITNGVELDDGTPFAAEVHYAMVVHKAHAMGTEGPIAPSSHTDTTLVYDLAADGGTPITMSKLNMSNEFTIYNATGSYGSIGYSNLMFGTVSNAVHGFPGLVYKDTVSLKSDPEVTIFHDRVTESNSNGSGGSPPLTLIAVVSAVVVVVGAASFVVIKRRGKPKG